MYYFNELLNMSKSNLECLKQIIVSPCSTMIPEVVGTLSLSLKEYLPNVFHIDLVENKALELINSPTVITLKPATIIEPQKNISCRWWC